MTSSPLTDEQLNEIERHGIWSVEEADHALNKVVADARLHRAELAKARAEIERLRGALEWYTEHAVALASGKTKNVDYVLAVVTELNLDAGKRGHAALPEQGMGEKP